MYFFHPLEGASAQASLPAPVQYPSLLAGNEVGRIASSGRSSNNNGPTCNSRGHHGRCFMLQHHFHHRSRRTAGPTKALLPASDGSSPPSFQASPPTADLSHFSSVSFYCIHDKRKNFFFYVLQYNLFIVS